ncbi:MAG: ATP-dependent DNA helicase RecQ [Spirochaetia bacterium]|nr:ATP-dependent DNA helicase RecQ [Spirochaetia bacterium]
MYLTKEELIEKRKALEAIIPTIAMEIEQVPEIFHNPKDKKNGAERLDWAYSHTIYQKISRAARSGTGNQSQTLKLHPTVQSILHEILSVNENNIELDANEKDYLNQVAKEHFGIPYLFPYQRLAISNVLDCAADPAENNPAQIVILPTGAGKSLCFMLPVLLTQGITLIIFPLLSLMADQKRRLDSAGIPSLILRGGLSKEERSQAFERIKNGEVKIIIANPEILLAPGVLDQVKQGKIFHVVIDEAHTVSQWGDTFRSAYLELGQIVANLKPKVTTAFTATASAEILSRFAEIIFGGIQPNIIRADPDRPNIRYDAIPYLAKDAALLKATREAEKPLIVFCSSRDGVEITARRLKQHMKGQDVWFYHAGLSREEKKKIEDKFFVSAGGVLVATCAYGMGVDKSNIRTMIHADLPSSAEAYLQESGRGGRDRKQAYAMALVPYVPAPESDPDSPDARRRKELYDIFTGQTCRRKALLHILEHESQLCTGCDVCDKKVATPDGLAEILDLVRRNSRHITEQKVSSILKGNLSPDNIQKGLYRSKSWGLLSSWDEKEIKEAIGMLTRGNYIKIIHNKKLCIKVKKRVEFQDIM